VTAPLTVGDIAEHVRSKNAGPFWQTIDIFFANDDDYHTLAANASLDAETIARLYHVDPDDIHIYRLPEIRAVKISFPRPTTQGGRHDRDMHAGQQHIPISQLAVQPPEHKRAY
jgi:Domain of unknown function (DUF4387)